MGVIGSIVAGIASYLGASGAVAAAIGAAVNLGLAAFSIVSSMGAAKEQRQAAERARLDSIQRNAFRNFRQPLTPRRIVFGRCRVAGPIVFAHNRKRHGTHIVVALAAHEVEEIESVWILEDEVPFRRDAPNLGRVFGKYAKALILQVFTGTATQNIGAAMIAAEDVRVGVSSVSLDPLIVTTDDRFKGIAAIYAITRGWSQFFEGETPEFAAIVKGNKAIYDPRTETTGYTANPALCAAWYLTAIMGFPWSALDETALIAAADVCDEEVALKAGGTETRYECHGVISADMQHREALDLLARSMAGTIRYASGKWIIQAGAASVATPVDLGESNALAGYKVLYDPPDRSLPNAVRGSCVDPASWQPRAYPQRTLPIAVTAEGGPWWLDLDLPLTLSRTMAQRIARIELMRSRARCRFSVELDLRGLKAQPGSIVTWSAPDIGMEAKTFEVDAFAFSRREGRKGPVLGTRLDLVEYHPDTYAWNSDMEGDGDTGSANPGEIDSLTPENACYSEQALFAAGDSFSAEYDIPWTDPVPEEAFLSFVRVDLLVTIVWDNAGSPEVTAHSASADIGAGVEEATLPISTTNTGRTYVSHEVKATLKAFFSNGLNSGEASLGACPLPPASYTVIPDAGSMAAQGFTFESQVGDIRTCRGTSDPDLLLIHDVYLGLASILEESTGEEILQRGGADYETAAGDYYATLYGMDNYNGGAVWNATVT